MEDWNSILTVPVPFIIQMLKSDSEMHTYTSFFNTWLLIVFYHIT